MSKYKNPIDKAPTVVVTRWEYANLISQTTQMRCIERLMDNLDQYRAYEAIRALLTEEKEE